MDTAQELWFFEGKRFKTVQKIFQEVYKLTLTRTSTLGFEEYVNYLWEYTETGTIDFSNKL